MKFISTKGKSPAVTLSQALEAGMASDGGLYVPEEFPHFEIKDFDGLDSFSDIASKVLEPFFKGDQLESSLKKICNAAFSFPVPLKKLKDDTSVLELFHGPTAAFKDVGARFLAECFVASKITERTILVATSGDTGGAVAAAFHKKPGIKVVILFPKDGVSERQKKQLTCWGDNVEAFAVNGTFDDCQKMVKDAFADKSLRHLSSANSINIGRLLPQMSYYVAASLWYSRLHNKNPGFIIPSGNFGNALGALWAHKLGLPIREIAMSVNANKTAFDYFKTKKWEPRPSVQTLANAMDVGNPSNMERVFHLKSDIKMSCISVSDDDIRKTIVAGEKSWGEIWCPHTATAVSMREEINSPDWIIVSTAHPAKFDTIVEPLLGHKIEVPNALSTLLSIPSKYQEISSDTESFKAMLF